jgi:UMF1 family MFS transporter
MRFLVAHLIFNDGLVTIFAFGGIYAAATFGFTLEEVILFGIVINIFAGAGAVVMGYLDDRIGAKRTLSISLLGLIVATLLAMVASDKVWFWVAGIMIGIFAGPNQSASRSLMGRLVPQGMHNEFFGFFALSGKLTAFIGPFVLGLLTQISGSQRVGVTIVVGLFVVGLVLLQGVATEEEE